MQNGRKGNKMKKGIKKGVAIALTAASLMGCAASISAYASFGTGVAVMAQEQQITKSAIVGKKVIFSDLDFKQGLCISDFGKITITAIPQSSDGTLMLAGRRVGVGTTIKRKNIGALVFVPASKDIKECFFKFTTEDFADGAEVKFTLKFLEKVNYAPTITESAVTTGLSTQREIGIYGKMCATDIEQDEIQFVIISYPENGILRVLDEKRGDFLYTPLTDYVGEDSFTYVAKDEYGNFSKPQNITVNVTKRASEVVYEDMKTSESYNAAVALTALGAVDGRLIGDGIYFMPDTEVTRAEFVTMAMKCFDISPADPTRSTYFDDNDDIPTALAGYVSRAADLGIISGAFDGERLLLRPNDYITKYEAAVVIQAIIDCEYSGEIPVFSDASSVPVWAKDAVYSLCMVGVFDKNENTIDGGATLSKKDAVEYLYRAIQII